MITITFHSGPEYEQVRVFKGGAPIPITLVLNLRPIAKGEYRELARRGFRTIVLERTERCVRAGDATCCRKLIDGLIRSVHSSILEANDGDD